jgi:hypothetical protein
MRFLLDEDLSPTVAETARGLGLDALSIHEVGRRGLRDDEQLRLAAADGRTAVEGDRRWTSTNDSPRSGRGTRGGSRRRETVVLDYTNRGLPFSTLEL